MKELTRGDVSESAKTTSNFISSNGIANLRVIKGNKIILLQP